MAQFGGHNPPITACYHFSPSKQTNADYIKRSDAINAIFDKLIDGSNASYSAKWFNTGMQTAMSVLDILPGKDVVPVVRCKDCKWWKLSDYNTMGIHICQRFSGVRGEHDFCSRGETDND
jgi:hypothetical protein